MSKNRRPEQDLINLFLEKIEKSGDKAIKPKIINNIHCKSKSQADMDFIAEDGTHWIIEAKSHDSKDKYNTVHKFFGEILKETGRDNREDCCYAMLINEEGEPFYRAAFNKIDKEKFGLFGELIPISAVFVCSSSGYKRLEWLSMHDV